MQLEGIFKRLEGLGMFCLGMVCYFSSWALRTYWTLGPLYNDIFTAVGISLIVLYACSWLARFSPKMSVRFLNRLSKESYIMYLIHGPLLLFILKPVLERGLHTILDPFFTVVVCGFFCAAVFMLAKSISRPMGLLTSRLATISAKR